MPKLSKQQLADLIAAAGQPAANGIPKAPAVTVAADGTLEVTWPTPKPESFTITSDAFQQLIDLANNNARYVAGAKALFAKIGTLGEQISSSR